MVAHLRIVEAVEDRPEDGSGENNIGLRANLARDQLR